MPQTMHNTILITGATDGIGLALARHYAARGERLILTGRRPPAELDQALFTPTRYSSADLAAPPEAAARLLQFLEAQGVERLDLLIHNAGVGAYGPPAAEAPEVTANLLAVNVQAPITITHALLPRVLAARGSVVFVSSVATALPTPQFACYTASKSALEGFARALRVELRGRARVQVIRPGATRTGMHAKSGALAGGLRAGRFPPAERVAAQIARAIAAGQPEATIGALNRLVSWAGRLGGRG